MGCQVLEMPGSGASLRAPGGARPQSPQTWLHPRDPGALGLGPACRVCEPLPGAGGCRLGVPACAHSSVTSGPRAWGRGFRLSDGIRIAAHLLWATCQTDARSSDSPTGSFPTWHQKVPGVTWACVGHVQESPGPGFWAGGLLNSPLHREAVAFSMALEDGPPTWPW